MLWAVKGTRHIQASTHHAVGATEARGNLSGESPGLKARSESRAGVSGSSLEGGEHHDVSIT